MKWGCFLSLALLIIALVWFWNSEWLKIDTCLDGSGRWDKIKQECEH